MSLHDTAPAVPREEQRFQVLIEHSSDMIGLHDRLGTITYVSPSTTRLLGYRPQDLVGRNTFEVVHPDDRERIAGLFFRLVERPGETMTAEYRLRHADGSWRWIEGTGTNLLDEPDVRAVVVNFHDITARTQAEAALREKEAQYHGIFEATSDGREQRVEERTRELSALYRADETLHASLKLDEMRALIFELRPESLAQEGLVAALHKQAASLEARHSLEVRADLGDEPDLPLAAKEALYRIAQEALHNVTKPELGSDTPAELPSKLWAGTRGPVVLDSGSRGRARLAATFPKGGACQMAVFVVCRQRRHAPHASGADRVSCCA